MGFSDVMDRARGTLLGAAYGDALGAGYEFGSAPLTGLPEMIGGGLGNFAPGEWTDDTAQTFVVAQALAEETEPARRLDSIAQGLADWFASGPPDIGIQTRKLLSSLGTSPSAVEMRDAADGLTGKTGGNGALMRTSPVALAHLSSTDDVIAAAATDVARLTHSDPQAAESCVLWCLAIRRAVVDEILDLRAGLTALPAESAAFWEERITEAEKRRPGSFKPNGWTVTALQAAWTSVFRSQDNPLDAINTAISIGDDTDTIASICGALMGARHGTGGFPSENVSLLHGWPGVSAADLTALVDRIVDPG